MYLGAYIFVRQDGGLFVRLSGGLLGQKKVLKTQKKKVVLQHRTYFGHLGAGIVCTGLSILKIFFFDFSYTLAPLIFALFCRILRADAQVNSSFLAVFRKKLLG